jgi:importin-5
MSLLAPEFSSALTQLLRGLGSPDNNVRSQAEDQLNNEWVAKRPDLLLMGLVEQIRGGEDNAVSDQLHR